MSDWKPRVEALEKAVLNLESRVSAWQDTTRVEIAKMTYRAQADEVPRGGTFAQRLAWLLYGK